MTTLNEAIDQRNKLIEMYPVDFDRKPVITKTVHPCGMSHYGIQFWSTNDIRWHSFGEIKNHDGSISTMVDVQKEQEERIIRDNAFKYGNI